MQTPSRFSFVRQATQGERPEHKSQTITLVNQGLPWQEKQRCSGATARQRIERDKQEENKEEDDEC